MPKAPKAPRRKSNYVVLYLSSAGSWMEADNPFEAATAAEAMKAAAREVDAPSYVAVPARSWKPRRRTVEQVTKESWS